MAVPDNEDWERIKLGHFSEDDERLVRGVMGPWFLRTRQSLPALKSKSISKHLAVRERQAQVLMSRSNTVALGLNYSARKQAVVKVGFCLKSRRAAQKQVLYVARLRPQDKREGQYKAVPVWDGFGQPVKDEDIVSTAEHWDLPLDEDNLSKRARMLLAQGEMGAYRALGERKRLRNILTWHFIFSVEENAEDMLQPFRAAVRRTVDTAFTAEGHASLWAIHTGDTEHMHAHIIVKAQSELGGRIHSDIHGDYFHQLREIFAENLRRLAMDYEATRRVDRRPLRELIMAGQAPLHEEILPWHKDTGTKDPYAGLPNWSQVYGHVALEGLKQLETIRHQVKVETGPLHGAEKNILAAYLLRKLLDQTPRRPGWWKFPVSTKKNKQKNAKLSRAEWELLAFLETMYHNPSQALESLRLMMSDGAFRDENGVSKYPNQTLAIWTLRHRPELFGFVKAGAFQSGASAISKAQLHQIRLWSPERLHNSAQNDNAFADERRLARVNKDRKAVLAKLRSLHGRVEIIWPGSRRLAPIAQAIRQAERIKIGDRKMTADTFEISPETSSQNTRPRPISRADGGGEIPQQTPQPSYLRPIKPGTPQKTRARKQTDRER